MVELLAPAKVNLCLRVFGKTDTGLHNIDSIVVFCQFGDKICILPAEKDTFVISGPFGSILAAKKNQDNLVISARNAFRQNVGVCTPISITLEKHIPIEAGLGGGSADAAATLRGLNKIAATPLQKEELFAIAATLGSDVPVCLAAKPHRITGTGEVINQLSSIEAGALLLVNPLIPLSTGKVFDKLSAPYNDPLPDRTDSNAVSLCNFGNDLEDVAVTFVPEITEILCQLRNIPSCLAAQMSGSGASCFGVFENLAAAKAGSKEFDLSKYWVKPTILYPREC